MAEASVSEPIGIRVPIAPGFVPDHGPSADRRLPGAQSPLDGVAVVAATVRLAEPVRRS